MRVLLSKDEQKYARHNYTMFECRQDREKEHLSINSLNQPVSLSALFIMVVKYRQGFLDSKLEERKDKIAKLRRCVSRVCSA